MKKIIFTFLIIHFSLLIANAQWELLNVVTHNAVVSFADNGYYLYAAVPGHGVYKTSDNGETWDSSRVRAYSNYYNCLAAKDSLVYIANDSGLFMSINYGSNWTGPKCLNTSSVIIANNYLFVGTGDGVKRSSDWGNNWVLINNGIPWHYGYIRYFTYSNSAIYLAMDSLPYHLRIYKSTNYGDNWSLISQDIPNWNIAYSIYANDNLVFCGTTSGMYKSTNYGVNWNPFPAINGNIGLFGYASAGTKNIFISGYSCGVYVSNDYGQTFKLRNEGLLAFDINALHKFGGYIFVGVPWHILRRPVSEVIYIKYISSEIPEDYKLFQNYPNPFNPTTNIKYQIKKIKNGRMENSMVKLKVYDIRGKEIYSLVKEKQTPGTYEVSFNGNNFASGIYFYSLFVNENIIDTKKLILLK